MSSLLLVLLIPGCGRKGVEPMTAVGQDINKDGRLDQYIYTMPGTGYSPFIVVTGTDGTPESYVWIYRTKESGPLPEILHEDNHRREDRGRVWYGPGNRKLIARMDLDRNGTLETTVYYNRQALPQGVQGTVARFATDTDGDGKTDIWFFPGRRMEVTAQSGGPPALFTENARAIKSAFDAIQAKKTVARDGLRPLAAGASWVLHPARIPEERLRAVIERDL